MIRQLIPILRPLRRPLALGTVPQQTTLALGACLALGAALGGCKDDSGEKWQAQLATCRTELDQQERQVNDLKRKLATAIANPGTIKVDPSVLMIDGTPIKVPRAGTHEGSMSQQQVVATLRENKGSLQPCYNRALKRDSGLHHRKIKLNLTMKVRPSGAPADITIGPAYDLQMIDCMKKAIRRWKFPAFSGGAVEVESPMTFTPKK